MRMLAAIAGRTHIVYTGVTVMSSARATMETRIAETEVRMAAMSEREIDWYARSGEGLDKAGLLKAIKGHVVTQAELMGTYQR